MDGVIDALGTSRSEELLEVGETAVEAIVVGAIDVESAVDVDGAVDKVDVADTEAVGFKPEGNTVTAVPVTEAAG